MVLILCVGGLYLYGIHPAIVLSGSMEPEIQTGSLCFINTKADIDRVKTGDIIAYSTGDIAVTHRVVAITDQGFQTKGDANDSPDVSIVPRENVDGKTIFWVPYIGRILAKTTSTPGRIIMCMLIVILLLSGFLTKKKPNSAQSGKEV